MRTLDVHQNTTCTKCGGQDFSLEHSSPITPKRLRCLTCGAFYKRGRTGFGHGASRLGRCTKHGHKIDRERGTCPIDGSPVL